MPVAYGLLDPCDLPLPALPPDCVGLRIAHLTDLHISAPRHQLNRLANQLLALRVDLVFLTGDYMNTRGDEEVALEVLEQLCSRFRPRIGAFGVFGNHDLPEFREEARKIPHVRWLHNESVALPGLPIEIMGLDMVHQEAPDAVQLLLRREPAIPPGTPDGERGLRLMIMHSPSSIPTASDLGADFAFCGHTHGGQVRLPGGRALFNASDLPLALTSGLIRHRDTVVAISRGLGNTGFFRHRIFCRPHAPVYTLRRGSLPGRHSDAIQMLRPW